MRVGMADAQAPMVPHNHVTISKTEMISVTKKSNMYTEVLGKCIAPINVVSIPVIIVPRYEYVSHFVLASPPQRKSWNKMAASENNRGIYKTKGIVISCRWK